MPYDPLLGTDPESLGAYGAAPQSDLTSQMDPRMRQNLLGALFSGMGGGMSATGVANPHTAGGAFAGGFGGAVQSGQKFQQQELDDQIKALDRAMKVRELYNKEGESGPQNELRRAQAEYYRNRTGEKYTQTTGYDESGKPVYGSFDPRTGQTNWPEGTTPARLGGRGEKAPGETRAIISELMLRNPDLTYEQALEHAKRGDVSAKNDLALARLAQDSAKLDPEANKDWIGTLNKHRQGFGLPPLVAPPAPATPPDQPGFLRRLFGMGGNAAPAPAAPPMQFAPGGQPAATPGDFSNRFNAAFPPPEGAVQRPTVPVAPPAGRPTMAPPGSYETINMRGNGSPTDPYFPKTTDDYDEIPVGAYYIHPKYGPRLKRPGEAPP